MGLRLITPASAAILTAQEAKSQCRVLHDDDDEYFGALCEAVHDWLDGPRNWLGRSVRAQTWEYTVERFPWHDGQTPYPEIPRVNWKNRPPEALVLPKAPLIEVDGLFYTPSNGGVEVEITTFRTIDADSEENAYLLPAKGVGWPTTDGEPGSVRVRFTAGYATIPASIKHAARLTVAHWYENREAATEVEMKNLPMAVDALLSPYRNWTA